MTSLPNRFAAKLASNVVGLLAGGIVVLVVPRALGAADYGTAEFLLAFFTGVVGIVDVGTSNGYYAWLSRRPNDAGLVRAYVQFALIVGALILLLVLLAFVAGSPAKWLWPQVALPAVAMGCLAAWLVWMQQLAQKTVDARGLTTIGEVRILTCRSIGSAALVAAALWHVLTFGAYLWYLVLLPLVTTFFLAHVVRRETMDSTKLWLAVRRTVPRWRSLADDFKPYVVPLIPYSVSSALATLADRWVLQHFGGAVQQGLYSLSNRTATLCFVFSAAMTQLLTREFAIAWGQGDKERIGQIFTRYVPPLYAISAAISVFVAWHAGEIVVLLGGRGFAAGAAAMIIMAFYPMHQTLGQLGGAVFYGTASMRIYAKVGIAGVALGLALLWVMVGPHDLGGLDLGSVGLAVKMVATQFVTVNLLLFFVARTHGIKFWRELRFQLLPPLACLPVAAASAWIAHGLLGAKVAGLLASAALYGVMIVPLVWYVPWTFGLQRGDMQRLVQLGSALSRRR